MIIGETNQVNELFLQTRKKNLNLNIKNKTNDFIFPNFFFYLQQTTATTTTIFREYDGDGGGGDVS